MPAEASRAALSLEAAAGGEWVAWDEQHESRALWGGRICPCCAGQQLRLTALHGSLVQVQSVPSVKAGCWGEEVSAQAGGEARKVGGPGQSKLEAGTLAN